MTTALIVLHFFICIFLIVLILLQSGKGADIGAAFGGASQTVFGSRGPATFLNKFTAVVAILFLIISIWLAQLAKTRSIESVVDTAPAEETLPVPEVPAEQPVETK